MSSRCKSLCDHARRFSQPGVAGGRPGPATRRCGSQEAPYFQHDEGAIPIIPRRTKVRHGQSGNRASTTIHVARHDADTFPWQP